MDILKQLGDLFLAAVPTAIIVFLFYLFLRWSFFTPIARVVAERARRIEGVWREGGAWLDPVFSALEPGCFARSPSRSLLKRVPLMRRPIRQSARSFVG